MRVPKRSPRELMKSRKHIEELIWRQDREEPSALDDNEREDLRVVIRIAFESDETFKQLLRKKGPIRPDGETDYLCDTIRSGIDSSYVVVQASAVVTGVTAPRRRTSLRAMLVEHGKQLRHLGRSNLSFAEQLSTLLILIHIESSFWGQFWTLNPRLPLEPRVRSKPGVRGRPRSGTDQST